LAKPRHSRRSPISLRGVGLGLTIGLALGWFLFAPSTSVAPGDEALLAAMPVALGDSDAGVDGSASKAGMGGPLGPSLPPGWAHDLAASIVAKSGESKSAVLSGRLERGESLTRALGRYGVPQSTVTLIANELRSLFDFRDSRPGDFYRLELDQDGRVRDFVYVNANEGPLHLYWDGARYHAEVEKREVEIRTERIAGVVENTLYEAILALGEDPQLANAFSEVFTWEIDFRRGVRPGDSFSAVYERAYEKTSDGGERYVGLGRILAATYVGTAGDYTAYHYKAKNKPSGYYRADGTSLEGRFLFRPVETGRISSGYSNARRHPILKVTRPHHGIDWAAPRGSPVWAVASGEIIFRGRNGGFGNLVKIRHENGYVSYYGHLEGFPGSLRVGDHVRQKQVIGFVGSTGLSTGPHVDFRMKKGGRFVNPRKVKSSAGPSVAKEDWSDFQLRRDELTARLLGSRLAANEKPST